MQMTEVGHKLCAHYEGCPPDRDKVCKHPKPCALFHPYQGKADRKGVLTIYRGHVIRPGEEWMKDGITAAQGEEIYHKDIAKHTATIEKVVHVPLKWYQFDALGSFQFNLGPDALAHGNNGHATSLLTHLNHSFYDLAASRFYLYCNSAGKYQDGLFYRRLTEAWLFLTGELVFVDRHTARSMIRLIGDRIKSPAIMRDMMVFYNKKHGFGD